MTENRCINCMRKRTDSGGVCPHCGFDPGQYKPPEQTLPPGAVLNNGKYIIGRILGRGGFGVTYVALDTTLELRVAIKECLPRNCAWRNGAETAVQWGLSVPEQEAMMESFVKEARKMAKTDEIPGVVRVREYFYDNETAYIVMNYVEGETLARYLRRKGPMNAEECFRILAPAMDSLAQAHKRGLVHRDISPNNIMIEKDGEKVWVLDLGAAKDLGSRISAPNVSMNTQIVGTPGYTPLEQYSPDGNIGPWTDVYAMSSTFFRCMTGQKLQASTSRALKDETPELLRTIRGPVGAALSKGLAQNPDDRYQSMTELRDALEEAIEDTARTREYQEAPTEILVAPPEPEPMPPQPEPEPVPPQPEPEPVPPQPETPKAEAVTPPPEVPKTERKKRNEKQVEKQTTKMIIIVLLVGVTILASLIFRPQLKNLLFQVIPASGKCGETASWTLTKDGIMTISGTGNMYSYAGKTPPWNDYVSVISKVSISSGITSIGYNAFEYCGNLTSVEIPDSVTQIEGFAFYNCSSLTSVVIPDSVTKIMIGAFGGCSRLESVSIPANVEFEDFLDNSVEISAVFDEHTAVTIRGETLSVDTSDGDEPEKTWALAGKEPEELWNITQ